MKENAIIIVWAAFIEGAKRYEPFAAEFKPVDEFHMFHFDREWFLELFCEKFNMIHSLNIENSGFFALRKK